MRADSAELAILYRISDGSYKKEKFDFASKFTCLFNCVDTFGANGLVVFADTCRAITIHKLRAVMPKVIETSTGSSAQSWRNVARYALDRFRDEQAVYFLEDDYLHRPGSKQAILEGLKKADYVTLYDHPDKYRGAAPTLNPLIVDEGEWSQVLLNPAGHWKYTNSTTMTFACRVKTLRDDIELWLKHTEGTHPDDFAIFTELLNRPERKRKLLVSIPGYSTHTEKAYPSPHVNWRSVAVASAWKGCLMAVGSKLFSRAIS